MHKQRVNRAVDLKPSFIEILNAQADLVTLRFTSVETLFLLFVCDVYFGIFLVNILVHGKILIISGHFFVIPKYEIFIINELMVGKREITAIFSKLKQIISFGL